MRRRGSACRARLSASVALAVLAVAPQALHGQGVEALSSACVTGGAIRIRCTELAVTARALQGHLGLLSGPGSEVSGSASTLGRRLGATPRIAIEARASFAKLALPDLADPGEEPSRESTFIVPVLRGGVTAGIFDGFSLLPTVGGFLGVDVLVHGSIAFLPTGEGFDAKATALTVGARIGILRESFTLPGVSVSVVRRWIGGVQYGSLDTGGGSVEVDPAVTSIRATVGKDLLSIGVLGGIGWDRYSGHATIRAASDGGPVLANVDSFKSSRRLIFGGAAMNFLVLQMSGEIGWAQGFHAVEGYSYKPFDPTSGTWYGSIAFRLTI